MQFLKKNYSYIFNIALITISLKSFRFKSKRSKRLKVLFQQFIFDIIFTFLKHYLSYQDADLSEYQKVKWNLSIVLANKGRPQSTYASMQMGDYQTISTQLSQSIGLCHGYMEKHYINIAHNHSIPFVQILLITSLGLVISQRTVFYAKFKQFAQIDLSSRHGTYTLYYDVKEESKEEQSGINNTFLTQNSQMLDNQQDRVSVVNLGLSLVRFAQRVDPVVYLFNKVCHFVLWKDTKTTFTVAVLLTLFIYYLEIGILLCGAFLYFGQGYILKKFQKIHKYDYANKRILFPQQNADFIHSLIEWYSNLYQSASNILFAHDKTFLIKLIKLFCKLSLLNVVLIVFFDYKTIFIIFLWAGLIFTSPLKSAIAPQIQPLFLSFLDQYFKVTDKLSKQISLVIKKSIVTSAQEDYQRQFYLFQYQNWTLFSGWAKELLTIPNENDQCITTMKVTAPQGWIWRTDWKIDYEGDVDEQGFQYFKINKYTSSAALSTRRRRKWKRCCVRDIYS